MEFGGCIIIFFPFIIVARNAKETGIQFVSFSFPLTAPFHFQSVNLLNFPINKLCDLSCGPPYTLPPSPSYLVLPREHIPPPIHPPSIHHASFITAKTHPVSCKGVYGEKTTTVDSNAFVVMCFDWILIPERARGGLKWDGMK